MSVTFPIEFTAASSLVHQALGPGARIADGGEGSVFCSVDRLDDAKRGISACDGRVVEAKLSREGLGDVAQIFVRDYRF